jgi:hypothetical protein
MFHCAMIRQPCVESRGLGKKRGAGSNVVDSNGQQGSEAANPTDWGEFGMPAPRMLTGFTYYWTWGRKGVSVRSLTLCSSVARAVTLELRYLPVEYLIYTGQRDNPNPIGV